LRIPDASLHAWRPLSQIADWLLRRMRPGSPFQRGHSRWLARFQKQSTWQREASCGIEMRAAKPPGRLRKRLFGQSLWACPWSAVKNLSGSSFRRLPRSLSCRFPGAAPAFCFGGIGSNRPLTAAAGRLARRAPALWRGGGHHRWQARQPDRALGGTLSRQDAAHRVCAPE